MIMVDLTLKVVNRHQYSLKLKYRVHFIRKNVYREEKQRVVNG